MTTLLPQVLLFAVLTLFLIFGFLYKRAPKTIKEYALGGEKISTPVLMATMIATAIGGGSLLGASAAVYQHGLWFFVADLAIPIGYCITALVVIPKLSKYYGCLSIAEIIGQMYGNYARKIVGITAFLFCVGALGAQIKAFHWLMQSMFVDNALLATIMGLTIVILYSSMGGVSSVIRTDVIQFFIFIIIVPLVASHMLQISGGITQITNTLSETGRTFFYKGGTTAFIALTIYYLAPDIMPMCFHRFLIGRDCKKNQAITYALALVNLVTTIFVGCIAFIALSKFPDTSPQNVLFVVLKNLIAYEWMIVAFVMALVAIIISTADSLVNTGAIILTNDILPNNIAEEQKIKILKVTTVLSGVLALSFACFFQGVLDIVLFVAEYYFVIVLVPFIGGLFIKETRQEPFWASVIIGFSAFTILHFTYGDLSHEVFLISLITSLISYMAVFFVFREQTSIGFSFSIRRICDGIVEKNAIQPNYLGWIVLLFFLLSVFVKNEHSGQYGAVTTIECITGFLGFSLLFIDNLWLKYKSVMTLCVIWYCFAFSPTYVFLYQGSANLFTMNFIGSMLLLAGLFSWDVFLTSVLSGSIVAVLACCFFGPEGRNLIAPIMYLSLLLGCIALIAYLALRKKELGIWEFIEKKLKASNDIEQATKESQIFNQIIRSAKVSLDAQDKYRDVLLNENETIMVSFNDLKDNMLAYFQQKSAETRTKLTIVNTRHKVLNTGLPLSFFYRTIYSLIANVFNCNNGGEIVVRFCCDRSGKIGTIEISHGPHKVGELMRYFRGPYPENILGWDILIRLFEQLEIKVMESSKKLKITFPSESKQDKDNIVYLEELLQSNPVSSG